MKTTLRSFKPTASEPQQAIVVIFDLEDFSRFCGRPDAQEYVPKFLNVVMSSVQVCFEGGEAYWTLHNNKPRHLNSLPPIIHFKFLGDGALYIFNYDDFSEQQRIQLINRLWVLRTKFGKVVEKAAEDVPVLDVPQNIRFGITAGTVYRLTYIGGNKEEYVGHCINLASRLEAYCRPLGITISGRLKVDVLALRQNLYMKVIAKNIKGLLPEIVIVDRIDFENLDSDIKSDLFEVFNH